MPCYHLIAGYRRPDGKVTLARRDSDGTLYRGNKYAVPCGRCWGCKLERSRQMAIRCMHEAQLHDNNCLITLTYEREHLPPGGSLDKTAIAKFMKRLRRHIERENGKSKKQHEAIENMNEANASQRQDNQENSGYPAKPKSKQQKALNLVRYFGGGEYGSKLDRPHYHMCLFGWDFPDKYPWAKRGQYPIWRSDSLEQLWPFGHSEIGTVTFESAAYIARYILKKINGPNQEDHYNGRVPEFATGSRRPGLGARWIDRYGPEVYTHDSVIINGQEMKPPRYYDSRWAELDPTGFEAICRERQRLRKPEDSTDERLAVREQVAAAKLATKKRSMES